VGVTGSYCVTWPPHDGEEYGGRRCATSDDWRPRRLSVVRPRSLATLAVKNAVRARSQVHVSRLDGTRFLRRAEKRRPRFNLRLPLRPGKYQIEIFTKFVMPDGRFGDAVVGLGVWVSRSQPLRIVAAPKPPSDE